MYKTHWDESLSGPSWERQNGSPTISRQRFAVLGRQTGPAPTNQPPLPPDAFFGAASASFLGAKGVRVLAPGHGCVSREEYLRRFHGTVIPKGDGDLWWLGNISVRTTANDVYPVRVLGKPGANHASSSSSAAHGFDGGRTWLVMCPGPHSERAPSRDPT